MWLARNEGARRMDEPGNAASAPAQKRQERF